MAKYINTEDYEVVLFIGFDRNKQKKDVVVEGQMGKITQMLTEVLIEVPELANAFLSAVGIVFSVLRKQGKEKSNEQLKNPTS